MNDNPATLNKLKICNFIELNNLFYCQMPKEAAYETARWLVSQEGIITHLESNTIYFYNQVKGIYEKKGEAKLKEILTKRFKHHTTKHLQREIINHIRNLTLREEKEWSEHTPTNKIPVRNGLVDIETGKLEKYNKNYWFTHQIPITYDPKAKCEKIDAFFKTIVTEEDRTRLYDLCGLAITTKHLLEKFYILVGKGSNGKSIFLQLLTHFIGRENTSTITLQQLSEDVFAKANTYRKLLNAAGDIGNKPITDTAAIKNFTGGERLTAQFKNKQHFDMDVTATLVAACNQPPIFYDDSDGFYRRPELINFPYTFGNKEDIRENPHITLADPRILDKIITEEELSGLFNKAIEHLREISRKGSLSVEKSTQQLKQQYLRTSNSVASFVNECCEPAEYRAASKDGNIFIEAEGCVSNEEFYKTYSAWCEKEKLNIELPQWIPRRLKALPNWLLDIGLQDHYGAWGTKRKSVRGLRIKEQTHQNLQTRQTQQPSFMDELPLSKAYNRGNGVSAVSSVLNDILTPEQLREKQKELADQPLKVIKDTIYTGGAK